MSALIATLRDDMEDNAEAAAWGQSYVIGSATKAETGGRAVFTLPASTAGTHESAYKTSVAYDLTGDGCYININQMVSTAVAAYAFFQLWLSTGNYLRWFQQSNTIKAQKIIAGVVTDLYSATWSATTYKYLRIRESAGTTYFDSSTNGTAWTNRASLANPFAVTDLFIWIAAGVVGSVASPGAFRVEDVNLILPALTTNWRWQQEVWPFFERTRNVTIAIDAAGTVQGYLVTADGIDANGDPTGNVRYWSGPMSAGRVLTEQATQAAAQAMAVNLPLDGRIDLPGMVEARCFRLYDRSIDGNPFIMREFYARRLVQADDIEAEAIKALHIAAHQINADHLDVIDLDATTYITAGGGVVTLDDRGMTIIAPSSYFSNAAIRWTDSGGTTLGELYQLELVSGVRQMVLASRVGSQPSTISLLAEGSGQSATITMAGTATTSTVDVTADMTTFQNDGDVTVSGGLNVGTATGATTGQILATIADSGTNNTATVLTLGHNSSGTPTTNFGAGTLFQAKSATVADRELARISAAWATATDASRKARAFFFVYDTAARECMRLEASGTAPMAGFLGAAAVARPTVTGSRGANAALASVLTALANLGLITDSSS